MEKSVVKWVVDIIKTVVIAVLVSMVLILVFALIMKATNISEDVASYVNVGIKIVSIAVGCLCGFRRGGKGGWLKGIVSGLLYVVTSFLVFSFISGSISLQNVTWLDFVTGAAVGTICGVLAVNVKKSPKIA